MSSRLNDEEKELYADLVSAICMRLTFVLSNSGYDIPNPYAPKLPANQLTPYAYEVSNQIIWHRFDSAFEDACVILLSLGLVEPLNNNFEPLDDGAKFSHLFRIKYNYPEIRTRTLAALAKEELSFLKIIDRYRTLQHYGNIQSEQEPKNAQSRILKYMNRIGFAEVLNVTLQRKDHLATAYHYGWSVADVFANYGEAEAVIDVISSMSQLDWQKLRNSQPINLTASIADALDIPVDCVDDAIVHKIRQLAQDDPGSMKFPL